MLKKALPTSRLSRFARLAALGAKAGVGHAVSVMEGGPVDAKVAAAAAEALGTMRGLALKLGQMASYVDGFVPENGREAYEQALRALRSAAPTMSAEGARRVIREELGADPEELFASFEAEPFASASIGQVHRARLADGREVAVKVQFEDVERAVRADLANASMFGAMLGPMGSKVGAKDHMRELEARFLEELDYRHEARQMAAFARPFEGHPRVRVPRVVEDRSARRVLTTELARGVDFEAACARPEAEREAWAETLWRFTFRSILGEGLFNADPHPGNYVFADDGVVWFLDFGCVRVMTPATHEHVRRAHGAALDGDSAELSAAFRDMFGVPHGGGTYARLIDDYVALAFEPIRTRGPYRMTRAYVQALVDGMRDNTSAAVRALFRWDDFRPMPAELLFFNRLQFGFYSVLARLDVDVDYGRIDRECLEQRRG